MEKGGRNRDKRGAKGPGRGVGGWGGRKGKTNKQKKVAISPIVAIIRIIIKK